MIRPAATLPRLSLLPLAAAVGMAFVLAAIPYCADFRARAEEGATAPTAEDAAPATSAQQPAPDPTAELAARRDQTRAELDALSKTISLSSDKVKELQDSIAAIGKNTADLRQALIASATKRKEMDQKIQQSEKTLTDLKVREDGIRQSLHQRRGLLAEVLAALERMGRNPPPALLVSPDDALASVRSAILLGAVVPGMRKATDKLLADLGDLSKLEATTATEKASLTATLTDSIEEERRMDLLIAENDKHSQESAAQVAAEKKHAEELAGQATSLEGLVASLESQIGSVRDAAAAARLEQERRAVMTDQQRADARALAESGVPDKNRIAPAYRFSDLKQNSICLWLAISSGNSETMTEQGIRPTE